MDCCRLAKLVYLLLYRVKAGGFFSREFEAAFDLLVLSESCREV